MAGWRRLDAKNPFHPFVLSELRTLWAISIEGWTPLVKFLFCQQCDPIPISIDQRLFFAARPPFYFSFHLNRLISRCKLLNKNRLHRQSTGGVRWTRTRPMHRYSFFNIISMPDIIRTIRTTQYINKEIFHKIISNRSSFDTISKTKSLRTNGSPPKLIQSEVWDGSRNAFVPSFKIHILCFRWYQHSHHTFSQIFVFFDNLNTF